MIIVTVFYPNEEGKHFDIAYYVDKHVPMVRRLLGQSCTNATVQYGIAGGVPGSAATYIALGHLHFNSIEDFVSSFTPNAAAILADVPNYTNTSPIMQISEVKM